jgi:chromosome segregation ATPase
MAAAVPDTNQLLELLQRAADELKVAQQETNTARTDAETFARKISRLEIELTAEKEKCRSLRRAAEELGTSTMAGTMTMPPLNRTEERTNVSKGDSAQLEQRLKVLQEELDQADAERHALRDELALEAEPLRQQLEAAQRQLADAQRQLAEAAQRQQAEAQRQQAEAAQRQQAEAQRQQAEKERQQADTAALARAALEKARGELEAQLDRGARLEAELTTTQQKLATAERQRTELSADRADVDELLTQNARLETELTSALARAQTLEQQRAELEAAVGGQHARLAEASARVAELEQEAAGLRTRRDGLNVELAHAEKERNAARARVAELESAAAARDAEETRARTLTELKHRKVLEEDAARRAELELQVAKEKERMQLTAQRLLDARARTRELELELEKAVTNVARAEAETAKHSELHREALTEQHRQHDEALAGLGAQVLKLEGQLAHASTEWVHVNRQYEALHREMLVLLDQRDEARRELAHRSGERT